MTETPDPDYPELMGRMEATRDGDTRWHTFDRHGYDVWGYDRDGRYNTFHDRAPFQASPFHTEHTPGADHA